MTANGVEDWLDILDKTEFELDVDAGNTYQSYRFASLDINETNWLILSRNRWRSSYPRPEASKRQTFGVTLSLSPAMRPVRRT
jgi:hypothetical protein